MLEHQLDYAAQDGNRAGGAWFRGEGRGVGAQLAYRQRRGDRDGLVGGVQHRRTVPHRLWQRGRADRVRHRSGTVATATDWDGPVEIKTVLPSRTDSYEHLFLRAASPRSLTDWRGKNQALRAALAEPRLERAIGVIYRPETVFRSHYFEAVLADQFNAFLWFEETRAVTPLGTEPPHDVPDTYPFGL